MTNPKISLKSSLRKSVIGTHRARGKGLSNLWLVYSIKTNNDWILPSDRQLIHWIYFLEINPKVATFDLAPDPILSADENETRATELDAYVEYKDGSSEWHEVKANAKRNDPSHLSQKQAQINASLKTRVNYKRFNDDELKPKVKIALRWLTAISFAAQIRDQEHLACRTSLVMTFKKLESGNVKTILDELEVFEKVIVLGMLVRLAIEGVISLNLNNKTFGLLTPWQYCE
jgi:hypothetical protein